MSRIESCTAKLISEIKKSEEYKRYQQCETALLRVPGLREKIDRMRSDTFSVYHGASGQDLISDSEMLEKKYEMLQRIPEAQEYLRAETDLCVLLREICGQLTKEAGVRLPGKDYGGS
ncbi:MAG: YlbF family regulator [Lachnospiraceae bacterium]|jgi:cell fate (sporulation/competence/biofilm development) regulator YmcA (YheA/YmcA/DUF963 family)|nr:YlbF family regulator [Lachnospiraceae bacterium]